MAVGMKSSMMGQPHRLSASPWKALLLALSIALTACGDAGSSSPSLSQDSEAEPTASVEDKKPYEQFFLGEKIDFDAFEVQVASVQKLKKVGVLDQRPAEGGIFVAIEYKVKNTGDKPLGMFERPSFKLVDDRGTTYSPDLNATMQHAIAEEYNAKSASELNPGITTRDGAVWEIAADRFDEKAWKLVLEGHENSPIYLRLRTGEQTKTD